MVWSRQDGKSVQDIMSRDITKEPHQYIKAYRTLKKSKFALSGKFGTGVGKRPECAFSSAIEIRFGTSPRSRWNQSRKL
jgi:hypothetical protein